MEILLLVSCMASLVCAIAAAFISCYAYALVFSGLALALLAAFIACKRVD